jgi:hypothetical protein
MEMKIVVSILIFVEMSVSISCPLIRKPDASGFSSREKTCKLIETNRLRGMRALEAKREISAREIENGHSRCENDTFARVRLPP